jgi:hypothetical protein
MGRIDGGSGYKRDVIKLLNECCLKPVCEGDRHSPTRNYYVENAESFIGVVHPMFIG